MAIDQPKLSQIPEHSACLRFVMKTGIEMAEEVRGIADRAWSLYLMMNSAVDENDQRRSTLHRFIQKRYEAGERDFDELVTSGLVYLRKLDSLGDFEFN
jgi:hypothetical protein